MEDRTLKLPEGGTVIALPYTSKQGFDGATVSSLIFALINGGLPRCMFNFYGDYDTIGARNQAAKDAVRYGAEWLFFVDSDSDFPVDTLPRLKALNADIACADMWSRNIPSFRTVLVYGPPKRNGLKIEKQFVAVPGTPDGPMDVDCCGMHCTLIKADLIKKFFNAGMQPFVRGIHGEDAGFCILAKQKFRASIRCDFGIVAGHWGKVRVAGQDWTRDPANQPGTPVDREMLERMGVKFKDPSPATNGQLEPGRL